MNERMTGQYIPGNSALHGLDARAKLICFILLIAAVILSDSVWGYALVLCFVGVLICISGLSVWTAIGSVKRMFWFFVLIIIMNALFFTSENAFWQWWIISLSVEGLVQGFNVVFRILIILVTANIFTLVTPPLETTHAIQALLKPLRLVRMPADEIAMILSVAIQFIPTLLQEADTVKKAHGLKAKSFTKELRRCSRSSFRCFYRHLKRPMSLPWPWKPVATVAQSIVHAENTEQCH